MATKLFKIGESSYYGKWRLTVKKNIVEVEGIDYFTNEVKESKSFNEWRKLRDYLEEVSTFGWADTMMDWVDKHTEDTYA